MLWVCGSGVLHNCTLSDVLRLCAGRRFWEFKSGAGKPPTQNPRQLLGINNSDRFVRRFVGIRQGEYMGRDTKTMALGVENTVAMGSGGKGIPMRNKRTPIHDLSLNPKPEALVSETWSQTTSLQ